MEYLGRKVYLRGKGQYPTVSIGNKNVIVHVHVWEQTHGTKPNGFVIHHKDENKLNWAIENLQLLAYTEHKKIHAGWIKTNGVWTHKPCYGCKTIFPIEELGGTARLCKECRSKKRKTPSFLEYQKKHKQTEKYKAGRREYNRKRSQAVSL